MKRKYFTKSVFQIALACPRRMYYQCHKEKYANLENEDEFLQALAEGGFQVGELASIFGKRRGDKFFSL